jgi:hypothetical protein
MTASSENTASKKIALLEKGKYVFIDELDTAYQEGSAIPFFFAKAIFMAEREGVVEGEIRNVNISDLILKQSSYVDEQKHLVEAHKLYVWPRNLGSTNEWTAAKREFLNDFVMNFPIEILSLQEHNGVTWRYISPENFKKIPEELVATPEFEAYRAAKETYFFLRRPINEPR